MNWLYYLLEANLYLAVFYGCYRLFLHEETFYSLNRYYLITATILSFVLPLLQVGYLNTLFAAPQETMRIVNSVVYQKPAVPAAISAQLELSSLLYGIYLSIAIGFLVKTLFTLTQIFSIYFKSKRHTIDNVTFIELKGQHAAFSFFNILFINPNLKQKDTILKHEMVHIKQNHSADVLFFEIIQIISWFNPIVYFLKRDIKLLHEYLADEQTTAAGVQKHEYALFLIQHSFGPISNTLSNQIFNESLLKRRIKMLNKQKSGGLAKFRLLLMVPVATCLLCASTMAFTKDYALVDLFPQKTTLQLQDTSRGRTIFYSHKGISYENGKDRKSTEKRAVVVNGRVIINNDNFDVVEDFDHKKELSPEEALTKYGEKGKFGAVELSGPSTRVVTTSPMPPATPGKPAVPPATIQIFERLPGEKPTKATVVEMQPPTATPTQPKPQPANDQTSAPAPKTITVTMKQPELAQAIPAMKDQKQPLSFTFIAKPTAADGKNTTTEFSSSADRDQKANAAAIKEIELKLSETQSKSGKVDPTAKVIDPLEPITVQGYPSKN
ncbi:M56 family metallopeptidase [Pedobacter sp. L105]|uniref:M56 family metallopeptidase n=1 Tax=Pedobacter sp. L105 TaxID=1641871 RepID=UPI00131AEDB1|nr:M56 family metallopeptidase [Pedobacter sp. L105]